VLALYDLDDSTFCAPIRAPSLHAPEHAVPIHRVADAVSPDEKVPIDARDRRIGHKKSISIAMRY
jgi:hypothetical protein